MRTGAYPTPDEVVKRALKILRSEDDQPRVDKLSTQDKMESALAQFERGDSLSVEESHGDMENRKNKWLAEDPPD